jgi:hypothetical protein
VCCHSTDTSTKMDAMKMMASAICDTGRLGNGLTSRSEPELLDSSCQPGKVASRRRQMKAKMMAMILGRGQGRASFPGYGGWGNGEDGKMASRPGKYLSAGEG